MGRLEPYCLPLDQDNYGNIDMWQKELLIMMKISLQVTRALATVTLTMLAGFCLAQQVVFTG